MNRFRPCVRARSTASVRPVARFALLIVPVVLALTGVPLFSSGPPAAAQPAPVTVTTPYTDVAVQPKSSV